jgi:glycosyltransferase involved in cell wall biosynthesis
MATIRMAKLLKELGHAVILYASDENEAPCNELVSILSKEEQKTILAGCKYQYAALDNEGAKLWELSNKRCITEIGKRKKPRDFILIIGGTSQQVIADANPDIISIEYSIGYIASFSKYRIYESHYWRAWSSGKQQMQDGRFFDDVIPLFFDEDEFTFRKEKEPFALYVGRLTPKKGLSIACEAAEKAGIKLKCIGHGDTSLITHGAEYLGAVSMEERNDWMSRASVLICPTLYIEPFGSIAVEAQLCGTPVVSTAFGGFIETIEHGKTGYHCNYLGEFVRGLRDAQNLDHAYIRQRAVEKYSYHNIKHQYQKYFDRLLLLWGTGFNSLGKINL